MTRETWLAVQAITLGVAAADACYCANEDDEKMSEEDLEHVIVNLANDLSAHELGNCISILNQALTERTLLDGI